MGLAAIGDNWAANGNERSYSNPRSGNSCPVRGAKASGVEKISPLSAPGTLFRLTQEGPSGSRTGIPGFGHGVLHPTKFSIRGGTPADGERGIRSLKLAIFLTISPFMLHGTTSLYALAFSICSACFRDVSVSLAPLSMRATSSVRSSPLIGRTVVRVRPPTACFSIT
jgi:hypothetical protein